jgi:molecular chaperone HtpG
VKRVLTLLEELAGQQPEKFSTFWREFGRVLKEGAAEDPANRDRIAKLLRFASTHGNTEAQDVSLAEYVGRMKPEQEAIYYITADGFAAATHSPHLEIFRKTGIEVLLMYDRVDEWVVSMLTEFEGKPLQSVAKGGLDLGKLGGDAAKQEQDKDAGQHAGLVERIQAVLKDRASAVRVTSRLTDSPSCLVSDEHGLSTNLERMLKAAGQHVPGSKPVLEINPRHPIVERLEQEQDENRFADWSHILFDQATLAEGGHLDDPATFVKRLNELMLTLSGGGPSRIWMPGA